MWKLKVYRKKNHGFASSDDSWDKLQDEQNESGIKMGNLMDGFNILKKS